MPVRLPARLPPDDPFEVAIGNDARAGQRQSIGVGEVATVLDLRGDDFESRAFTCSLGWFIENAPGGPETIVEVQARVWWGSGGAILSVVMDVPAQGLVLQVCSACVRVEMIATATGLDIDTTATRINVCGFVSSDPRPNIPAPIRGIVYPAIGAAPASAELAIPAFAATVDCFCDPNTAAAPAVVTVSFHDAGGNVIYEAPIAQRALPVPRGAVVLRLTNGGAGALVSARAIYSLRF